MGADPSILNVADWKDPLKSRGWTQSGGLVVVDAALPGLNATTPREFQMFLEFFSLQPQAVELEVQTQAQPAVVPGGFPDGTNTSGARAGANSLGSVWDQTNGGNNDIIIAKFETGSGADARVFYGDVRPGRFSLGVQQRVRISVARWLRAGAAGTQYAVQGSIAPARGTDADPITYTCGIELLAGADEFLVCPPGALYWWFDMAVGLGPFAGAVLATLDGAQYYRDCTPGAPVQSPAGNIWTVPTGPGGLHFINMGASNVSLTVTFWVR